MEYYFKEVDRSVLILTADGGLNMDVADEFVHELETLIETGVTRIIVDLSRLTYISSYGIGVLVRLHHRLAKKGGDVKLAAPQSGILKALNTVRLGGVFQIYPDLNAARLAFRPIDRRGDVDGKCG
jgi:anti-anti-sigma factor